MEIEVAKEKEEAASEQGEGSVYFFFNQGSIGTKYCVRMSVEVIFMLSLLKIY